MNTREAAELYGVSIRTIQRWIVEGYLTATKHGNRYEILDVDASTTPTQQAPTDEPQSDDDKPITYSTAQYAALVGVSQRTVQRWIQAGKLNTIRVGRAYVITPQAEPEDEELVPEQPPEEPFVDFPITDISTIDTKDLRSTFGSLQDAVDYAAPIPVPWIIIMDAQGGFHVQIDYDVFVTTKPADSQVSQVNV